MQGRMATYSFTGDADDLTRRGRGGHSADPQVTARIQELHDRGRRRQVFSMSAWDTRADAEAGNEALAAWVAENLADELTLKEVRYAEIKLSTTLGVSATGAAA